MYNRGKYIPDAKAQATLNQIMHAKVGTQEIDCSVEYEHAYRTWISKTKNNRVQGLDLFPNAVFSHGTTESFDKFYTRHADRTLKVLAGEYSYHTYATDCTVIDNTNNLGSNDCVVVSLPFADNGGMHLYNELMQKCVELNIPVLVDCCWFGTCSDIVFDFTYSCIEDVVFSLSKTFAVNKLRIGCRFSKDYVDGLSVYKQHGYTNFYLQHVAMELLEHFDADYMCRTYRSAQLKLCTELGVDPSPVVNLATGKDESWAYLNRGGPYNRLCISDQLTQHKYTVRTAPADADRRVLI